MTADAAVKAVSIEDVDLETRRRWMSEALTGLYHYVRTPAFRAVLGEMNALPTIREKDHFVRTVLLNPEQLAARGATPPEGVVVQRSRFEDARPTVFCVVKYLPDPTKKMTITFDQGEMLWPTEF
jgi:hypothetical protein